MCAPATIPSSLKGRLSKYRAHPNPKRCVRCVVRKSKGPGLNQLRLLGFLQGHAPGLERIAAVTLLPPLRWDALPSRSYLVSGLAIEMKGADPVTPS